MASDPATPTVSRPPGTATRARRRRAPLRPTRRRCRRWRRELSDAGRAGTDVGGGPQHQEVVGAGHQAEEGNDGEEGEKLIEHSSSVRVREC